MADGNGLRDWQRDARERYHSRNGGSDRNFLVVATPGAGKTTFSLTIAQDLIERSEIEHIVVIVPTSHLRRQWAESANRVGIKLDHTFVNGNGTVSRDFDGVVVTYQAVASAPLLWQRLCSRKRTLVIFDEIHHAGDGENLVWGDALKDAFQDARRRLLLSGTPFRTDGKPIPFVTYGDRRAVYDYNYDYGMALTDGGVVRPAAFPAMDGKSQWRRSGEVAVTSVDLIDTDKSTVPPALKAALDPAGKWIPSVLHEAHSALTEMRLTTPDAAGLVVASDQFAAVEYAKILERICRYPVPVAISDEPKASEIIKDFAKDTTPWIVAVQMIAEGVDIPRLGVGVYASRVRTQMFFIQVVGRFVRMRGDDDPTTARVFIPSIQPLLGYAQDIEKTVDAVLAEEEQSTRQLQEGHGDGDGTLFPAYETVDSSAAIHHATIANGSKFTPEELEFARQTMEHAGPVPATLTRELVATILNAANLLNVKTIPAQRLAADTEPLGDRKQALRKMIKRKVGYLAMLTKAEHMKIHGDLNYRLSDSVATATLTSLEKRIELLDAAIKEAKNV